ASSAVEVPPRLRLPGLDPDRIYTATVPFPLGSARADRSTPDRLDRSLSMTGAAFAAFGMSLPVLHPERAMLIELAAQPE
ncbi:MAG: hypothetical protein RI885_2402, partial [Actinomycetota bacterium]